MHSSASSIFTEREKEKEREKELENCMMKYIVKRESWVYERGGYNTDFIVGFGLGHRNSISISYYMATWFH